MVAACASASRAQEAAGQTDEERLERAKEEQAESLAAEKAAEEEKARVAAAEAAAKRVEALGVDEKDLPPEEKAGFFVGAEAFLAEIGGADRDIARVGDLVTAAVTAEDLDTDVPPPTGDGLPDAFTVANQRRVGLAYDGQAAPMLEIGYRLESGAAFSLRYFGWSSSATLSVASSQAFASQDPTLGGLVLGGIDNQGFENTAASFAANPSAFNRPFGSPRQVTSNQLHGADSVTASGKLEISRFDLLYSRSALARRRFELGYRVGITVLDVQRSEDATFTWRSFARDRVLSNSLSMEDVSAACETTAMGPLVGATGRFGITENRRWSVRLGVEVAGLKAERKLRFRDVQQFSQDGLPTPPPDVYQDTTNDDSGDFVTIVDGDAALEYRLGQRLRVGLGYRVAWWGSALAEERFPSGTNPALLESRSVDLDVAGPYIRLGVFF